MAVYFPSLNGVRFLAAFMVIISHLEGFKDKIGLQNLHDHNVVSQLGHQGVKIFFVLSGFLITFLLLSELKKTNTLAIKKFYTRRILRIWPLYFLILTIGLLIMPLIYEPDFFSNNINENTLEKVILYLAMLPNLALYLFGSMYVVGILWSIGAEEQFYLVWPHLIKHARSVPKTLFVLLIGIILIKIMAFCLWNNVFQTGDLLQKLGRILYLMLPFDSMVLGGFAAHLYFSKSKLLSFLYERSTQVITYLIILLLFIFKPNLGPFEGLIYSLFYAITILNLATNKKVIMSFENRFFNELGKISYGIYMYHTIFIGIFVTTFFESEYDNTLLNNTLYYTLSFISTLLIAYISYHYFESKILKYKSKFMIVKSHD